MPETNGGTKGRPGLGWREEVVRRSEIGPGTALHPPQTPPDCQTPLRRLEEVAIRRLRLTQNFPFCTSFAKNRSWGAELCLRSVFWNLTAKRGVSPYKRKSKSSRFAQEWWHLASVKGRILSFSLTALGFSDSSVTVRTGWGSENCLFIWNFLGGLWKTNKQKHKKSSTLNK